MSDAEYQQMYAQSMIYGTADEKDNPNNFVT